MINIPKSDIDEVVKVVQEKCDYVRDGTKTVYTSGFGANFFKQQLQDGLKVK